MAMVVVAPVLDDLPTPEHPLEEFERRPGRRRLGDRELVLDLPAEEAPGIAHDRYREAAFAVDEADDPLLEPWPFLLIARTGRIVTAHGRTLLRGWTGSTAGYSGFPAYSRVESTRRRAEGQDLVHVPGRLP